jgi:hypothetical protein
MSPNFGRRISNPNKRRILMEAREYLLEMELGALQSFENMEAF